MYNLIIKVGYPWNQRLSPMTGKKDIEQFRWDSNHPFYYKIQKIKLPICNRCGKEVESMRIIEEENYYKLDVSCHNGYESHRIPKKEFEAILSNENNLEDPGLAFSGGAQSAGILPRSHLGFCTDPHRYSLKDEIIQIGLVRTDKIWDNNNFNTNINYTFNFISKN